MAGIQHQKIKFDASASSAVITVKKTDNNAAWSYADLRSVFWSSPDNEDGLYPGNTIGSLSDTTKFTDAPSTLTIVNVIVGGVTYTDAHDLNDFNIASGTAQVTVTLNATCTATTAGLSGAKVETDYNKVHGSASRRRRLRLLGNC
jgi:hypothetical protein